MLCCASAFFPTSIDYERVSERVCRDYCNAIDPCKFQESGCAVCGILFVRNIMQPLNAISSYLSLLEATGGNITCSERRDSHDICKELSGPILSPRCD